MKKIVHLVYIFFFVFIYFTAFYCYSSPIKPSIRSYDNVDEGSIFMEVLDKMSSSKKQELDDKYLDFNIPVKAGDSLWKVLLDNGVSADIAGHIIMAVKSVYNPIKLHPGRNISMRLLKENDDSYCPISVFWPVLESKFLVVDSSCMNKHFHARYVNKILRRQIYGANAEIDRNLSATLSNLGLSDNIIYQLTEIFGDKINFSRDIKHGSSFDMLFECYLDENDNYVKDGDILFANIKTDKKFIASYLFMDERGLAGYYDSNGLPIKKELAITPVKNSRITSGFGMRMHPVYHRHKMHKGIDFSAPIGSSVYSTGEGIVSFVGYSKSYGKYIKITHDHSYTTLYAHLNSIKNGIKRGSKVQKDQLIGFVGSTGCTTGPHLHYEVIHGNINVDPLKVAFLDKRTKLDDIEMRKFKQVMNNYNILRSTVPRFIASMN
ncbi:M23 family metallopeptidase [Candidatus Xenohaliotis californiensis]